MSSAFPKLTEGSINKLQNNETVVNPILQIIFYKEMVASNKDNSQNKFRFQLFDGLSSGTNFLVISPNLIERIRRGEFERFTAVQLDDYTISNQQLIDKKLILIHNMSVVTPGSKIGKRLEKSPSKAGHLSNVNTNYSSNTNTVVKSEPNSVERSLTEANAKTSTKPPSVGALRPQNRSNICPINAITPYFNAWHIRARVTSKSNLRKYNNARGEGSVFSFDVTDESGEIRINAFNKECEKFYNMIEANKVYYITKGMVKTANKRFSNLPNDYEITLTQDSVIELCDESNDSLPKIRYKFVLIKDLANCALQSCVDIIGICKSIDDCISITSRKTNKELKKRDIYLVDKSAYEVRLTLWNEMAEQFDCPINSVLAVKNCIVGEFNGKTLSAVSNTTIQIDPEIPETNLLRNWFIREGQNITTNALSNRSGGDNSKNEWKFLCQLNQQSIQEERIYCNVRAKISTVGRNPLYKSCGQNGCLKKVQDNNNGFYHCDKCQTDSPNFEWRLILSLCLNDCTGDQWVTLFQDQAEKLLGISALELSSLQENNPVEYQKALASCDFKQYVFRVGSRVEQYMDETRVKSVCYSFENIDPIKHSKVLLQNIRAWSN